MRFTLKGKVINMGHSCLQILSSSAAAAVLISNTPLDLFLILVVIFSWVAKT